MESECKRLCNKLPKELVEQIQTVSSHILYGQLKAAEERIKLTNKPKGTAITTDTLEECEQKYDSDPANRTCRQVLTTTPLYLCTHNRDGTSSVNYTYSHGVDKTFTTTDQYSSGRCWIFAGLNFMRLVMPNKLKLNKGFELSEAFSFFYTKLEQCNFHLEQAIQYRKKKMNDPLIISLLRGYHVSDGGTWHGFVNIVEKYGVVPKECYTECYNTLVTREMNSLLKRKISEFTYTLLRSDLTDDQLRDIKDTEMVPEIYKILVNFMGKPPETFTWQYVDNNGDFRRIPDLTPTTFYSEYIEPYASLSTKIQLMDDPRREIEAYRTYSSKVGGNVVGGVIEQHVKVPMSVMQKAVAESLKDKVPVWFSCDVNKCFVYDLQILDDAARDYQHIANISLTENKEQRVNCRNISPCHAMLLTRVDIDNSGNKEKYIKWRVENSWGSEYGNVDRNHIAMSNSWFKKYVFGCVVDKKYLSKVTRQKIESSKDIIYLDPYDPIGSVQLS